MHNKVVCVKPAALQKKKDNQKALCLDSEQNPIQVKDVVKVSFLWLLKYKDILKITISVLTLL